MSDPQDVDERFRALIADELGRGWHPGADVLPTPPPDRPSFRFEEPDEADGGDVEATAEADEEEDGDFELPPQPPLSPPSSTAILIWMGLAYGAAIGVLMLAGVSLPSLATWGALVAVVASLVAAFLRLPSDRDPSDGDGAVV